MIPREQADQFLDGLWYVNVETELNPAGELRGQIALPLDGTWKRTFVVLQIFVPEIYVVSKCCIVHQGMDIAKRSAEKNYLNVCWGTACSGAHATSKECCLNSSSFEQQNIGSKSRKELRVFAEYTIKRVQRSAVLAQVHFHPHLEVWETLCCLSRMRQFYRRLPTAYGDLV